VRSALQRTGGTRPQFDRPAAPVSQQNGLASTDVLYDGPVGHRQGGADQPARQRRAFQRSGAAGPSAVATSTTHPHSEQPYVGALDSSRGASLMSSCGNCRRPPDPSVTPPAKRTRPWIRSVRLAMRLPVQEGRCGVPEAETRTGSPLWEPQCVEPHTGRAKVDIGKLMAAPPGLVDIQIRWLRSSPGR